MPLIIPVSPSPSSTFNIKVDSVNLTLRLNWNSKEEAYRVDFLTNQLEPILLGLKLVVGYKLTEQYLDSRLPDGEFICVDIGFPDNKKGERPAFDDLGKRIQLWYFSREEL